MDTRSVSLVVDDISSCSSLCGFNFVYFCFHIRIPNNTGIFNQRACIYVYSCMYTSLEGTSIEHTFVLMKRKFKH